MSGGSYNYVYSKIQDAAENLWNVQTDTRRASFQRLLFLVAKAMHEIEWVDSGDCGKGDEYKAIDDCFAFLGNDPEIIKKSHAYDGLKELLTSYFKEDK